MNYQELKSLNENIKKLKNQVDALKYYLHTLKSNDTNVKYLKVVAADMDKLIFRDMSTLQRQLEKDIREHEKIERDKEIKRKAELLIRIKRAMLKKASEEVVHNELKKVNESSPEPVGRQKESIR